MSEPNDPKTYLSFAQLATELCVSPRMARKLATAWGLTVYKIGRSSKLDRGETEAAKARLPIKQDNDPLFPRKGRAAS
jgi:hypothetical protein